MDTEKTADDQPTAAGPLPLPLDTVAPSTGDKAETEETATLKEFERLSLVIQRRTLRATVAMAIITAIYVFVVCLQWAAMQETNALGIRSAENAELATHLTKRALLDAQATASRADTATADILSQFKRSAGAAEKAAEATRSAAETATLGLKETRRSNSTAAATAELMAKQLEKIDRPMIVVSVAAAGSIEATSPGMTFPLRVVLMNSGRSPASNVRVMSSISYSGRKEPQKELDAACAMVDTMLKAGVVGVTIQPNDRHEEGFSELLNAETIRTHLVKIPGIDGEFFSPVVVGCVAYEIPYSRELHHTRFARGIYRKIETSILWAVYQLGVTTPASEVFFSQDSFTKEESD